MTSMVFLVRAEYLGEESDRVPLGVFSPSSLFPALRNRPFSFVSSSFFI